MEIALSIRVPEEMKSSLELAAKATDRSVGYLVRLAIGDYLKRTCGEPFSRN